MVFRIISPPDGGAGDLVDVGRGIGVFLGLIAAGWASPHGGWTGDAGRGHLVRGQGDRVAAAAP